MEKDKKYNAMLGIIIFLFILVVGISLAWGLSVIGKNSDESGIGTQNNGTVNGAEIVKNDKEQEDVVPIKKEDTVVALNEAKTISLTNSKKAEINDKLQTIPTQLMIMSKDRETGFNSGAFTDEEMIYLITGWDFSGDNKLEENRKDISVDYPKYEYEYSYIKEQVKKVFGKDINVNNTTYKFENGKLIAGTSTGFGIEVYKVKELVLNEKTNVYSLTFDNLELGDGKLEEANILNYANSDVIATYKLQYKKDGNSYILLGLYKI